jgi:hypothetical protein
MTEREYQLFPPDDQSWRSWITGHLRTHPDHARHYQPGYDFTLRSTVDIGREHERWHDGPGAFVTHEHERWHDGPGAFVTHEHDRPYRVIVLKENEMTEKKRLELKVTVEGADPDGALAKILKTATPSGVATLLSRKGTEGLNVTKVERADGQAIGLEAHFEQYWAENHCEGDDGEEGEKSWAREAFFYGVRWAKEQK